MDLAKSSKGKKGNPKLCWTNVKFVVFAFLDAKVLVKLISKLSRRTREDICK